MKLGGGWACCPSHSAQLKRKIEIIIHEQNYTIRVLLQSTWESNSAMGSTVSLVAGDNVDRGPEEEEEVGGGLLWRLEWLWFIRTVKLWKNFGSPFKIAVLSRGGSFGKVLFAIVADLIFWANLFHLFHHPKTTLDVVVTLVYKDWNNLVLRTGTNTKKSTEVCLDAKGNLRFRLK